MAASLSCGVADASSAVFFSTRSNGRTTKTKILPASFSTPSLKGRSKKPSREGFLDLPFKEGVEKEAGKIFVLVVRPFDLVEKNTADDASATPHESDAAIVQVPFHLGRSRPHEHKTLG